MRIIGPPGYVPNPPCSPKTGEILHQTRLANERKLLRRTANRKWLARLRCPECGDSLKIKLRQRWICRHCLAPMRSIVSISGSKANDC